ncbi:hypothetical protein KL942_003705 [Ogataea angusta]|uniref:Uncharacterized protein n=1 Tax=Pichia angusta TaxID=870730 RepID=A0ABQ7RX07_PICAN|nr:hypothetical protein KL942_003705 [Ogataea angusta]KAG7849546.1 hypothetical protein KL940_002576 [Ogataea angusta]
MPPVKKTPKRPSAITRIKKLKHLDKPIFKKKQANAANVSSSVLHDERTLVKDSQTIFSDDENAPPARTQRHRQRIARQKRNSESLAADSGSESERGIDEIHTFTQMVSKKSMRTKWAPLPPNVSSYLDTILNLYVEESISQIPFRSNKERLAFRTLVKDTIVKPLARKMRVARFPGEIKERLLDQEQLDEENMRLEANFSANLRQLEVLRVQEQKEQALLDSEEKYFEQFKKSVERQEELMAKDILPYADLADDLQISEPRPGLQRVDEHIG